MSRRGAVPTGVLSGSGGISFDPSSHGAALQLWRKADEGITLAGDEITAWADQVAGGDDAVPASGDRFNLIDPAQNGLPAVNSFGRSGAATLFAADGAIDDFWGGGGGMLVLAGKVRDAFGFGRILERGYSGDSSGETGWRLVENLSPNFEFFFEHDFSSTRYAASSNQNNPVDVPFVLVFAWDGAGGSTPTLRVNGTNQFNSIFGGGGSRQDSNNPMYNLSRSTLNGGGARMELFEYYFVKPAPASFTADEGYINIKWAIF